MKREQVSKLPGWYTTCLGPSSPACEKGSIQGHSVGRGGGGTSLAMLTQRGGKYPRRKEKHGGPEFAMGTTAWAPHSPSVGATVCSKFCIYNTVQYMIGSATPLLRGLNIKSFINFLVVSLRMHLV